MSLLTHRQIHISLPLHHHPTMSEPTEQQHTEEHDPQFEPVIRLTEQVEAKTGEEDDEVLFKMFVLLSVCRADH